MNESTTQPLLEELDFQRDMEIIGPDTALFNYQKARFFKDFKKADEVVEVAKKLGWRLSFHKTHYGAYRG